MNFDKQVLIVLEALRQLDERESNQTCNDFDIAQDAITAFKVILTKVNEWDKGWSAASQTILRMEHEKQTILDALGNGADEELWKPGTPWQESAAEAIYRLNDLRH